MTTRLASWPWCLPVPCSVRQYVGMLLGCWFGELGLGPGGLGTWVAALVSCNAVFQCVWRMLSMVSSRTLLVVASNMATASLIGRRAIAGAVVGGVRESQEGWEFPRKKKSAHDVLIDLFELFIVMENCRRGFRSRKNMKKRCHRPAGWGVASTDVPTMQRRRRRPAAVATATPPRAGQVTFFQKFWHHCSGRGVIRRGEQVDTFGLPLADESYSRCLLFLFLFFLFFWLNFWCSDEMHAN